MAVPQPTELHKGRSATPIIILCLHRRDGCLNGPVVSDSAVAGLAKRNDRPRVALPSLSRERADYRRAGAACLPQVVLCEQVPCVLRVEEAHPRGNELGEVPAVVRAQREEALGGGGRELRQLDQDGVSASFPGHHVSGVHDDARLPPARAPLAAGAARARAVDALRSPVVHGVQQAVLSIHQARSVQVVMRPDRKGPFKVQQDLL
mmetsp:Transcript_58951/g.172567  ORF Transcript_58951/g.172567 Transcript_58951/m.172567 type:complete len:206 (-) Transcript_58951:891-1508(-)